MLNSVLHSAIGLFEVRRPGERLIIASLLLAAALLFALVSTLRNAASSQDQVEHTYQVRENAFGLLSALTDAESAQRAFIITADDQHAARTAAAIGRVPGLQSTLNELTSDNADQQQRLSALKEIIERRIARINEGTQLVRSGDKAAAGTFIKGGTGIELMTQIRLKLAEFQFEESKLLDVRRAQTNRYMAIIFALALATIAIGSGMAAWLVLALRQEVKSLETREVQLANVNYSLERVVADRTRHLEFATRELSHRTKNLLAVVQAIASQTGRNSDSVAQHVESLSRRLVGMGRSLDQLVGQNWLGASIPELVKSHVGIDEDGESDHRISLDGPRISLNPQAAQYIGLALHELWTNSLKYGALSAANGKVHVQWGVEDQPGSSQRFRISWTESDGPEVQTPSRKGFGSTVTERMVGAAVGGQATLDYHAGGIEWRLNAPTSCLAEGVV